jgi:peptide methionine sulfoxide reductase msrA/msrB
MKVLVYISIFLISFSLASCDNKNNERTDTKEKSDMQYNKLTPEEERVIIHKGTEMPFKGKYTDHKEKGTYVCKRCDAPLYRSDHKFSSNCGWPSFDDEIEGAVKRLPDPDGRRIEIICANCEGHLGHVFIGEGLTDKNIRHCVNSISMNFIPESKETSKTKKAIFAAGCFWGVEYFLAKKTGVISTAVGYIGGQVDDPTYQQVCSGSTGHAEAVEVVYDPKKVSYEELAKIFFETHDPTQVNRQGPDVGEQYRSEIFYLNDEQKKIAEKLIKILESKGYKIATKLTKAGKFWEAEDYHQNYYKKKGGVPYCHFYTKRFD